MSKFKGEGWNIAGHIVIGGALAYLPTIDLWFIVFDTAVWAFLREQAQHRLKILSGPAYYDEHSGELFYRVESSTFFGWVTWWRMFEVGCWTFGSALALLAYEFFVA